MLRPEYWERSKEFIEWCEDDELKVLGQQADKALNKRMEAYIGRLENKDAQKKRAKANKIKSLMKPK